MFDGTSLVRWSLLVVGLAAVLVWVGLGRDRDARAEPSSPLPQAAGSWREFEKPSEEALRQQLNPLEYRVTQEEGTEPAFRNAFWDDHRAGIYIDVVSGEPLFSSLDKFASGTGWPSFTRPLVDANVAEHSDVTFGMRRVEVRSRRASSHLGHVFDDGPAPTGLRYCINSAALRFVSAEELVTAGYSEFATLFGVPVSQAAGSDAPVPEANVARPGQSPPSPTVAAENGSEEMNAMSEDNTKEAVAAGVGATKEVAILAGGCFWGMEDLLREIPGVLETRVGYTGGTVPKARYKDVKSGNSGHAESVRIEFDPTRLTYAELLGWFFRMHDPTTKDRQGNDRGSQYRSAIFYASEAQQQTATRVRKEVDVSGRWKDSLVTEIVAAGPFYDAEEYHQDYLEKNPNGYTCHYLRN